MNVVDKRADVCKPVVRVRDLTQGQTFFFRCQEQNSSGLKMRTDKGYVYLATGTTYQETDKGYVYLATGTTYQETSLDSPVVLADAEVVLK